MKTLRKTISAILATMMILVMAVPSFAETEKSSFIQDAMKITENDILQANGKVTMTLKSPDKDLNGTMQINTVAETQQKAGINYMEFEIPKATYGAKSVTIPKIKLYMAKDGSLYFNKDVVQKTLGTMGTSQMYTKDYIKVDPKLADVDQKDLKSYTAAMSMDYAKIEKAATKLFQSMDFAKLINVKKEGTTYSVDMNSDEMVDLTYNYIKWALTDFDQVLAFYKEMGMEDLIKDMPVPTKEDREKALAQMEEMSKTFIPMAKEAIKGSTLSYKADLQPKKSTEDVKLDLKLDAAKIIPSADGQPKPVEFILTINSNAQGKAKAEHKLPTSVYTMTKADVEKIKNSTTRISVDTKNNKAIVTKMGADVQIVDLKAKLEKGIYKVEKAQLETLAGVKIPSKAKYVPVRDITKAGFTVKWDAATKSIVVTRDFGLIK